MQGRVIVLLLGVLAVQAHGAFKKDEEAFARQQIELDRQCEAARNEKLAPLREAAFQECMNAKRGSEECRRKTAGENGNRIGGTPRFYDLPVCIEAFEHKRQRP